MLIFIFCVEMGVPINGGLIQVIDSMPTIINLLVEMDIIIDK